MNWGERGVATLATLALARILGPREFGTVAMAVIYVGFLQLFLEQGIGAAIVQREDLAAEDLDAAFWMNVAWSLGLSALSIALGRWWARLNHLPALEVIIDALSASLLIEGLTVVQESVLERDMRFRKLAVISNASALVGAAAGVALALAGAGVWALVCQQLSTALVSLVLFWALAGWTPRLRFSSAHAAHLLRFSLHVFAGNFAVFVNRRLDTLVIGLFFGAQAVGLYRLAARIVDTLLELTVRPIQLVALPHFSRLQRAPEMLHEAVRACVRASCILAVPALLALAACSGYVVAALGPAWTPAGSAMRLLCLAGIGRALVGFTGPLLQAVAKPHLRTLAIGTLAAATAPVLLLVASLLESAPIETQVWGMAASTAGLFLIVFVPLSVVIIVRVAHVPVRSLVPAIVPSFAAGVVSVVAVLGVTASGMVAGSSPLLALGIVATVAVASAAAVLLLGEPGVTREALGLWRGLLRRMPALPATGP